MDSAHECFVNPCRCKGEPEISGTVLLCVNPNEARSLGRRVSDLGGRRHFLFNSSLWSLPGLKAFVAGPAVGAPMAALTLEKLIALGGRRFVVLETCGAIAQGLAIGDALVPASAVGVEGTSRHYPLPAPPRSSAALGDQVAHALAVSGVKVHGGGCVLTTDAPYRETKTVIAGYRDAGVTAVDMEFSALLAVAAFRQVELAAVMVVSDLLHDDRWQPGFGNKGLTMALDRVARILLDFSATQQGRTIAASGLSSTGTS